MGLVEYTDSDHSDVEAKLMKKLSNKSRTSHSAFSKVVDRSNPGKIKISLPQAALEDKDELDERPNKKIRTDNGGLSDFNSFLPAPKNSKASTSAGAFHLKTGAAPAFSREPEPEMNYEVEECEQPSPVVKESDSPLTPQPNVSGIKLIGKPRILRPLSVSRNSAKRKHEHNVTITKHATDIVTPTQESKTNSCQKITLFGSISEPENHTPLPKNNGFNSIIYDISSCTEETSGCEKYEASYEDYTPTSSFSVPPAVPTPPISNTLSSLADNLNLSVSERRQLFGRHKENDIWALDPKIINFNTDEEYAHNEIIRNTGEQQVHNPVRAIAPGKHSLKQLVNAAQSQKEALEESFAKGKSNRAEASSRYGWFYGKNGKEKTCSCRDKGHKGARE
ncbi:unnamed protein product [Blumeria hordei]|uniref:Uncharacterized protein n=2 Tax=Blumeria hordei TaxID=2867405 RepID=A0A383UKW5_BLUHO|nr:unnamed protein product [Blumeria hordei]